jgi:hypothetical protein
VDSLLLLLVCFELVSAGKCSCFPLPDLCLPEPSWPCSRFFPNLFFTVCPFGRIELFDSDLDIEKRLAVARPVPKFFYAGELLFSEPVFCSDKCSSS